MHMENLKEDKNEAVKKKREDKNDYRGFEMGYPYCHSPNFPKRSDGHELVFEDVEAKRD